MEIWPVLLLRDSVMSPQQIQACRNGYIGYYCHLRSAGSVPVFSDYRAIVRPKWLGYGRGTERKREISQTTTNRGTESTGPSGIAGSPKQKNFCRPVVYNATQAIFFGT